MLDDYCSQYAYLCKDRKSIDIGLVDWKYHINKLEKKSPIPSPKKKKELEKCCTEALEEVSEEVPAEAIEEEKAAGQCPESMTCMLF